MSIRKYQKVNRKYLGVLEDGRERLGSIREYQKVVESCRKY